MRLARLLLSLFSVLLVLSTGGCQLFDPTYGMTPEEKAAYEVEQQRLAEERKAAEAEFAKINVQDLVTPGEGHDEARDARLAGAYGYDWDGEWRSLVLFKELDGRRHKIEKLTLFDNGSYARKLVLDKRYGKDRKDRSWESVPGDDEPVTRGQWKTEGDVLLVRELIPGGFGGWHAWGNYQIVPQGFGLVDQATIEAQLRQLPQDAEPVLGLQIVGENTFAWTRGG